jgi:hypothetical protein
VRYLWFCLNCTSVINLDIHGRCPTCGSDAVDIAVRPRVTTDALNATYEQLELEKIWRW